ncbi:TIGR02391 family protein [Luteimonas granuli]|uniref:TIGR02391 family protein n=1 Tax=Luteimonas granuli TaxID=1176533 RepID=A0A518N1L7_9GAMM|nr:TIGR02391 family protein [Luteimonas granuli]QDW65816.1 TIGR02391 family protein [Luteimonas granuli]
MPQWYFTLVSLLRDLRKKAWDAKAALASGDAAAAKLANGYMKQDYQRIYELWEAQGFPLPELGNLWRHIRFGDAQDYEDMLKFDIDFIAANAEGHARAGQLQAPQAGFEHLLHPIVTAASLRHYHEGDYRNAVLDGMLALSDLIRKRTGLNADGKALATEAFSLNRPKLIFSELQSESGQNDQKGFMEMIGGAYTGIRNPKAHSLIHDLDMTKAAQYLVAISLFVRRVAEANEVPPLPPNS